LFSFSPKGIFGKKYIIAPEYLADMVYKWVLHSGESETKAGERAEQFLKMIPDPDRRIYYAEKFHNYDVAIYVNYLFCFFFVVDNIKRMFLLDSSK